MYIFQNLNYNFKYSVILFVSLLKIRLGTEYTHVDNAMNVINEAIIFSVLKICNNNIKSFILRHTYKNTIK